MSNTQSRVIRLAQGEPSELKPPSSGPYTPPEDVKVKWDLNDVGSRTAYTIIW